MTTAPALAIKTDKCKVCCPCFYVQELELMIWSCSETIEEQSKKIIGTEKEKEKIQNELWKLVN